MLTILRNPLLAALVLLLIIASLVGWMTESLYWFTIVGPFAWLAYLSVETGDRVVAAWYRFRHAEGLARTEYRESLIMGFVVWLVLLGAVQTAVVWIALELADTPATTRGLLTQGALILVINLIFPGGRFLRMRKLAARRT